MRKLGLDLGTKTIGVAVSDEMGWTAQGIETIRRSDDIFDDLQRLQQLIRQYDISEIVLGFPRNMNGTLGKRAEASKEFADRLSEYVQRPVVLWDERLTTAAAERMLISADVSRKKRKKVIDKMAAVLILQSYLDRQQRN